MNLQPYDPMMLMMMGMDNNQPGPLINVFSKRRLKNQLENMTIQADIQEQMLRKANGAIQLMHNMSLHHHRMNDEMQQLQQNEFNRRNEREFKTEMVEKLRLENEILRQQSREATNSADISEIEKNMRKNMSGG